MTMRAAFPFLATGWTVLWVALSMAEGGFNFGAQSAGILLMIPMTGWLFGWLRADARPGLDMTRAAFGLLPVLIIGTLPIIGEHLRHLAPGGAHKDAAIEALEVACFWLPWLLLFSTRAWTGRSEPAAENRHTPAVPSAISRPRIPSPSVLVSVGDVLRPLPWSQILWLEADDNYVRVHTADRDYFVRRSLRELLSEAGERFVRIHKSRAVNLAEIAGIKPLTNGDGEIQLRSGQKLRMSRRFRQDLTARLKP
jgi:hypothetical protein